MKQYKLLLSRLEHNNKIVRKSAARQLATEANPQNALRMLQALLRETEPGVSKWLALGLAKMGDPRFSADIFRKAEGMVDGVAKEWVRLSATILHASREAREIDKLIESKDRQALSDAAQLIWAGGGYGGYYLGRLLRLTDHQDPGVRRWAMLALGQGGGLTSAQDVKHGLLDPDYLVREWTECAIASIKDPHAAGVLFPGLDDQHPRVREWAIQALRSTKHPEVSEILFRHLEHEPDTQCREAVYRAFMDLPRPAELPEAVLQELGACDNPVLMLAIIDLVSSSPDLRADNDLIVALDRHTEMCDAKLLHPYLAHQLSSVLDSRQKEALRMVESDASVRILVKHQQSNAPGVKSTKAERQRDIGVIIALSEEFREFATTVQELHPVGRASPNQYHFLTRAGYTGVVMLVGKKGISPALIAAEELRRAWSPHIIFAIGIAGSIHSDLRLGDVLIASQASDYLHDAKATPNGSGWEFHLSGEPYKINPQALKVLQNLEFTDSRGFHDWLSASRESRRLIVKDEDYDLLLRSGQIREQPIVLDGRLASGPVVGASVAFSQWLQRHDRAFKAVEMESAGTMASAEATDSIAIAVRGISDFADERKTALEGHTAGSIRQIAMRNAASLAMFASGALLEYVKAGKHART